MHNVEPKVFLVGETSVLSENLQAYLDHVGASTWDTDAPSDSEKLVEAFGRLCYRSWAPKMNPNVTRVREGNNRYLQHILEVGHGSVIEHAMTNWVIADTSRVVTHELVRHRAGTAFSQESLRFVRLEDLGLWLPDEVNNDPELKKLFEATFHNLEDLQVRMAEYLDLDNTKDFGYKKKMTSAMRRIAPIGLATTIGFSANMRSLRHMIYMRTSRHAEVEIRVVFDQMARICQERYPNLFEDFEVEEVDGIGEWTTPYIKV